MHFPTDRITHTTAFDGPVVDHCNLKPKLQMHPLCRIDRMIEAFTGGHSITWATSHSSRRLARPRHDEGRKWYTPTHLYTYTPTHLHAYTPTHLHTYTPTHIHYTHIYLHTYTHAYVHTYTHLHTYTPTHLHTYTHTHIHTYTRTHVHTCTHNQKCLGIEWWLQRLLHNVSLQAGEIIICRSWSSSLFHHR